MFLVPNSWGSLREANDCHQPAGRPDGGQFCAKGAGTHRVSLGRVNHEDVKAIFGRDMSETSLKALAKEMMAGVPGNFDIQIQTQRLEVPGSGGAYNPILRVTMIGDDGEYPPSGATIPATKLTRYFFRDDDNQLCVQHSSFEVSAKAPPHLGKAVLKAHVEAYQRLKVHKVETYANIDVGSYAWAKFGFVAEDPDEINNIITSRAEDLWGTTVYNTDRQGNPVGKGIGFGEREARALKSLVSSSKVGVWNLADFEIDGVKVGKHVLMQTDGWQAYLIIDGSSPLGERQMKRFWSYVGGRR